MSQSLENLSVSGSQVSAFRMRRHHLDSSAPRGHLLSVIGDTCGVQTQVGAMARIALWARIQDLTLDDIDQALRERRTIVKTWSMRHALHLHRASELPVILGGLMATRLAKERRWIERVGLREEATTRVVLDALEDGPITRSQLVAHLSKELGSRAKNWTDGGWGVKKVGVRNTWFLVQPAMARGLVCFGPSDGSEVMFVRTEQWLRRPLRIPPEGEAEQGLVRRYLLSFGPATAEDIRAWSGVYLQRIRGALERLQDDLAEVNTDGNPGYVLKRDVSDLETAEFDRGIVRLLPSFDPFMLGHFDRRLLIDRAHYKSVYKDQGWLAPVVLLDGRVVGTWAYQRHGRTLGVEVRMFDTFSRDTRRKIEEQAQDLARFLGASGTAVRFAG